MRTFTLAPTRTALMLALLVCAGAVSAQQMYRWVDKDGRVTYSQNPPPAGAAKNVQQRRITGGGAGSTNLPYATQVAAKNFPVTLFTSLDCGAPCNSGRDMLSKRGIPFREIVVGDEEGVQALRKLSGNSRIPSLQVGREALSGFEISMWTKSLDLAGYPSSIPASAQRQATSVQRPKLPAVKIFTFAQCGAPCTDAKALLDARGVSYQETSVESEATLEELKKVAGGSDAMPVLLVEGSQVRGFDPQRYNSMLDNAGFPRAGTAGK